MWTIWFPILYVVACTTTVDGCTWGDSSARCGSWSSCSRACGGGTQSRKCESCVWSKPKTETRSCNEYCHNSHPFSGNCRCPAWRTGHCCEVCRHIYIAHCISGYQECGGSPDGIKCTKCNDPYYPIGYNNGCKECPTISRCKSRSCTTSANTICKECEDNNVFFKKTTMETKCERMCSFNNHYCWPGLCGDSLTRHCQCATGFTRVTTSSETSCQPAIKPDIATCRTVVSDVNGDKVAAESTTASTACQFLEDMYGNFQPVMVSVDMTSSFLLNTSNTSRPNFISDETLLGLTDTTVNIVRRDIYGRASQVSQHPQLEDKSQGTGAMQTYSSKDNIAVHQSLKDGEWLCVIFEAMGGGYFRSIDTRSLTTSAPIPFQKTQKTNEICYRLDTSSPRHCLEQQTCTIEPLILESRVTRSILTRVTFNGWFDPIPNNGKSEHASQVESYGITVNEVLPSSGTLRVDTTSIISTTVDHSITGATLNLTSESPRLYCITLEVKDSAHNVQQARRFMLYDNTSYIKEWHEHPFRVSSAAIDTNFTWQTHHSDICLTWKNRFINEFYFHNELLNPIASDPHGHIRGIYDQSTGTIPVSGTPNVHGITEYKISWSLNGGQFTDEIAVQNFLNQSYCNDFSVQDGQTYTFNVRPLDIAGNTYIANRTVHIDRSVPHINNMWLTKDGYHTLFVHHETDLSKMILNFEALDSHSGIRNIEWTFGISDTDTELAAGILSSVSVMEQLCPMTATACYCPHVGKCAFFNYTIPLNKLVAENNHIGNHNRNYYLTIKATNNALLSSSERIDILVDDSPPEVGVIYEGPLDSRDIDYTSDESFIVHWHGFIDHESGIKLYRIGLASRCLRRNELYNFTKIYDIEYFEELSHIEMSARVPAVFVGKRYISIIALNNAMDPSEVVCSDGITRDISKPNICNITIEHASWSESIACHNGTAWLVQSALTKALVTNNLNCNITCEEYQEENFLINALPQRPIQNENVFMSNFMCQNLPKYNGNIIYIPNDHISISWDVEDSLSQIKEYSVGIGVDPSEINLPLLEEYVSTGRNKHFTRQHGGIGADDMFYIFIKAVNKAGMEAVAVLGPVIIDETPPVSNDKPTVVVTTTDVVVSWDDDTFYDTEQTEQIDTIFFQIGCGHTYVSSLLQWKLQTSEPCPNFTGRCFKYPLRRLQEQDTDIGLDFYIDMHVFNNAGHALKVTTEHFKVPSRYPPGHAIVKDVDPAFKYSPQNTIDADVHFTDGTLCATWSGFKHHQMISLEIGVGTDGTTDCIVPFTNTTINDTLCLSSISLNYNTKYFVLIRATSSGGSTMSSSNGVTIIDAIDAINALTVELGPDCSLQGCLNSTRTSSQLHAVQHNNSALFAYMYHAVVGFTYKLILVYNDCTVSSDDGILLKDRENVMDFVPFTENPVLTVYCPNSFTNNSSEVRLFVQTCPSMVFHQDHTFITAHWYLKNTLPSGIFYEAAILHSNNLQSKTSVIDYYITPYINLGSKMTHNFGNFSLNFEKIYKVAVRMCSKDHCLDPVFSEGFTPNNDSPSGKVSTVAIQYDKHMKCTMLHLQWEPFTTHSSILFYHWSICLDESYTHCLNEWQTVIAYADDNLKVNECVDMPIHLHSSLYACVRVFTENGGNGTLTVCELLENQQRGAYDAHTIYEFDATTEVWNDMKQIFSSSNLGNMYTTLHNNDLNFGKPIDKVAGVLLHASERNVTWYLMMDKHVPDNCDLSEHCITSVTTNTGFVIFNKNEFTLNSIEYICAHALTSTVERELFTEVLEETKGCSNGFVLDDSPPVPGKVEVKNTEGYLNNIRDIEVTWDHFIDNVNATRLGYISGMKKYRYAIGSRPGRNDIKSFTDVGTRTKIIVSDSNIQDGSSIFITIRGEDLAGNTAATTSQELIVDTSAPKPGRVHLNKLMHKLENGQQEYISSNTFTIYMTEFEDNESQISEYQIGIGSQPYVVDIMPVVTCQDNFREITLNDIELYDGHVAFVLVKARNRAGLDSQYVSQALVIDRSPPFGGHVMDGHWTNEIDEDYQGELTTIHGHWKGFSDGHSGLAYYRVGLGTKPLSDNIEHFLDVGLITDILFYGNYVAGTKYYVTVEACNGADLCTGLASDGIILDNSPPIQGVVNVGFGGSHHKYQSHSTFVHVQWAGFEDPQSGIQEYEMCIGKSAGQCDIIPITNCLLSEFSMKSGLHLPINTDLYATVVAHNHVGMNVTQVSNAFRVDVSPPTVLEKPEFLVDYTSTNGKSGQWDKSIIRLRWEFEDNESPLTRHHISLVTHHEGHTPIEHMTIGSENQLTINLDGHNWLHDGDTYFAVITSCNLAGLCFSAESEQLLVDSTPPHLGGFKYPLTWNNFNDSTGSLKSNVSLTWYGFHDQESGIERYFITLSHSYSGYELSDGVLVVDAVQSSSEYTKSFVLQTSLKPDDQIILTVWAENPVGLNSSVGRATVNVLSSQDDLTVMEGTLEIEKHSCDVHFCNKDCTCAVLGKPCAEIETTMICTTLDTVTDHELPSVIVVSGLSNKPVGITASSACLSGSWKIDHTNNTFIQIERFEVSFGLQNQPIGEGMFDLQSEIPWFDVGHRTEEIYCSPSNKSLIHGNEYIVYVRAWYNASMNAVFHSNPIKVDQTPPAARKGRLIKDSTELCILDYDIIDWTDTITACWDGVFSEQQGRIEYFMVSMGTNENADSIYRINNVGLNTSITLQNLHLQHGTKYVFTVTAYNNVGLHASLTSDGFIIDIDEPTSGIAFNTIRHTNAAFQSSNAALGISWHGFQDTHSGIRSYFTTLSTEPNITLELDSWINVGLQTKFVFHDVRLQTGKTYVGMVRAIDGAGHWSDITVSPGITIDDSPPKGAKCQNFTLVNATAFISDNHNEATFLIQDSITEDILLKLSGTLKSTDRNTKVFLVIERNRYLIPIKYHHGEVISFSHSFLTSGDISSVTVEVESSSYHDMDVAINRCLDMEDNTDDAISVEQFSTSDIVVNLLVLDKESSIQQIEIGLGTTPGGFQISALSQVHRTSHYKLFHVAVPHGTKVYATVMAENRAGLKSVFNAQPIVIDHSPPIITDLAVDASEIQDEVDNTTIVVSAQWKVTDEETGLKSCFCRLGSEPFLSDILSDWSSNTPTSCKSNHLGVFHGEIVYLMVMCVNNVQLYQNINAGPLVISILKPYNIFASVNFNALNENSAPVGSASIQNVQSNQTCLELMWNDFEDVSGINSYEYRIRTSKSSLVDWTQLGRRNIVSRDDLEHLNGMYTAEVRAINVGGLVSDTVSGNILVVPEPPILTGRDITIERSGPRWRIDWREVFRTDERVAAAYSLTIGTKRGYTDVLDIGYLSRVHVDVIIPESTIISPNPHQMFVEITCIYSTGLQSTYKSNYPLY